MKGIKIEVTGNIARVIERPSRITSGTVGLPVEFTFDSPWSGLDKVAVFRAGHDSKTVDNPEAGVVVPWELLEKPNAWLAVGVYGINADGTVVIPTIWANVCVIQPGVDPDGDPSLDPTQPIWQQMLVEIQKLSQKIDSTIVNPMTMRVSEVTLLASAWKGSNNVHSQVVNLDGITEYSQVDLKPSVEQLALFHEKDIAFSTENEDGIVTVYVVGDKPTRDYTMQVSIVEVVV